MDFATILGVSAGAVMIGIAGYRILKGSASSSWKAVPGEVLDAEVEERRDDDNDRFAGDGKTYVPVVRYSYTVHGKSFTGERISFGRTNYQTEGGAEEVVKKYRVGRKVRVFVSPLDPKETVLETGTAISSWLLLAAGVLILFLGPAMIRHA